MSIIGEDGEFIPDRPQTEQIDHLTIEIGKVLFRFSKEYDLPVESMVGVLEYIKADIIQDGTILLTDFPLTDEPEEGY